MNVLVVGSSVIDLFLKPDPEKINQTESGVTLSLGDKISTQFTTSSIGGNAANVAVALKKLEINSTLYTYLSEDFFSKEIKEAINKEGVEIISEKVTGGSSFSIILTFKNDRTILSHHDKCEYSFNYTKTPPKIIYLTSIGEEWEKAYEKVVDYCAKNQIQLAFSPGSHQMGKLNETFFKTLKNSKIFFSNTQEATEIVEKHRGEKALNLSDTIKKLHALGPKIISITDGEKGSYASDGNNIFQLGIINDVCVEKTGAGDTYAAGFLACYTISKDIKEAMQWGSLNSNFVIKKLGAHEGQLTRQQMEQEVLNNKNFQAKKYE